MEWPFEKRLPPNVVWTSRRGETKFETFVGSDDEYRRRLHGDKLAITKTPDP